MVASRLYRKLLFSPLAIYSQLSQEEYYTYNAVFRCAVEKLVALGKLDSTFCEKAEAFLKAHDQFCTDQRNAGLFVKW